VTRKFTIQTVCDLTERQRNIVLSGGLLNYVGKNK
jgi:hypothetical protein